MEFKNPDFNRMYLGKEAVGKFRLPYTKDEMIPIIAHAYKNEVALRGCSYVDGNTQQIANVADWITSLYGRIGLLLYGTVGTGKTTMLRALCTVINYCMKPEYNELTLHDYSPKVVNIIRAKDVVSAYQDDKQQYEKMCKVELLAIDEFGVEAIDVKTYGNVNEPIIDLLSVRYDRQRCTMISSNLDLESVRNRYGNRLEDRFVEMFKMVAFTGNSYRR